MSNNAATDQHQYLLMPPSSALARVRDDDGNFHQRRVPADLGSAIPIFQRAWSLCCCLPRKNGSLCRSLGQVVWASRHVRRLSNHARQFTLALLASLRHSFDMIDSATGRALISGGRRNCISEGSKPRIAVVRLRRDKAWVLPKGKLNPGERALAAAKREVLEETGYEVSVHEFLGSMSYSFNGKIKIVQFWHMRAIGEPVRRAHGRCEGGEVAVVEAGPRDADARA